MIPPLRVEEYQRFQVGLIQNRVTSPSWMMCSLQAVVRIQRRVPFIQGRVEVDTTSTGMGIRHISKGRETLFPPIFQCFYEHGAVVYDSILIVSGVLFWSGGQE